VNRRISIRVDIETRPSKWISFSRMVSAIPRKGDFVKIQEREYEVHSIFFDLDSQLEPNIVVNVRP
jgi:hypothetical protein